MSKDVRAYIRTCHSCQVSKPRHHRPFGLLVPLPVPSGPFQEISIDFVADLPLAKDQNGINRDSVLVVVDRFTKCAHFIPTNKDLTAEGLAELLVQRVFLPHSRIPDGIVSDQGSLFASKFWAALMHHLGTVTCLSTAWRPQTDGQTEHLKQILEHYLRAYGNHAQSDGTLRLAMAEAELYTREDPQTWSPPVVEGRQPARQTSATLKFESTSVRRTPTRKISKVLEIG